MTTDHLLVASVQARQATEQLFAPISHEEYVRMEHARQARVARRADRVARREARAERSRQRLSTIRTKARVLLTPDIDERRAPALRP